MKHESTTLTPSIKICVIMLNKKHLQSNVISRKVHQKQYNLKFGTNFNQNWWTVNQEGLCIFVRKDHSSVK